MSRKNLEQRAHREFYRKSKKTLNCDTNSTPCGSYETAYCNLSCTYAQTQKNIELNARKSKSVYMR